MDTTCAFTDDYAYPIAYRYGRVLRATEPAIDFDQALRCAEVIDRYLAVLTIASFAARANTCDDVPPAFAKFDGNLNWGNFQQIVQGSSSIKAEHPLKLLLKAAVTKSVKTNLADLCTLRNKVGHKLDGIRRSRSLLEKNHVRELLDEILEDIGPIATLPLFHAMNLGGRQRRSFARIFRLMGEHGDPHPIETEISEPFMGEHLYISCPEGVMSIHPMLIWDPESAHAAHGLQIIHGIVSNTKNKSTKLVYSALSDSPDLPQTPRSEDMLRLLRGQRVPLESVSPIYSDFAHRLAWHAYPNTWFAKPVSDKAPNFETLTKTKKWPSDEILRQLRATCGGEVVLDLEEILSKGHNRGRYAFRALTSNMNQEAQLGLIVADKNDVYGLSSYVDSDEYYFNGATGYWKSDEWKQDNEDYWSYDVQFSISVSGRVWINLRVLRCLWSWEPQRMFEDHAVKQAFQSKLLAIGVPEELLAAETIVLPVSKNARMLAQIMSVIDWLFEQDAQYSIVHPLPLIELDRLL